MAFPTTSVLDDFNRTDSATLGANWTVLDGAWQITTNRAQATTIGTNIAGARYNVASYGANIEGYYTIVTKPPSTAGCDIDMLDVDTNGYAVVLTAAAGTDDMLIIRRDGGAPTQLGATISQEVSNGDSIGIERISNVIYAYYKAGAGSWTEISGGRSDSTYSGNLYLAMITDSTTPIFDDFGGGTVVVSAPSTPYGYMTTNKGFW